MNTPQHQPIRLPGAEPPTNAPGPFTSARKEKKAAKKAERLEKKMNRSRRPPYNLRVTRVEATAETVARWRFEVYQPLDLNAPIFILGQSDGPDMLAAIKDARDVIAGLAGGLEILAEKFEKVRYGPGGQAAPTNDSAEPTE